jgi:hypothetical protein
LGKGDKDVGRRRPLSGMRGVVLGAGLGALAAKKGGPLVQKGGARVRQAMLKYLMSHGVTGQGAGGTPGA